MNGHEGVVRILLGSKLHDNDVNLSLCIASNHDRKNIVRMLLNLKNTIELSSASWRTVPSTYVVCVWSFSCLNCVFLPHVFVVCSDTDIGAGGGEAIADALKDNKTVTSINLKRVYWPFYLLMSFKCFRIYYVELCVCVFVVCTDINGIGARISKAFADALKLNTTVTSINLSSAY